MNGRVEWMEELNDWRVEWLKSWMAVELNDWLSSGKLLIGIAIVENRYSEKRYSVEYAYYGIDGKKWNRIAVNDLAIRLSKAS